MSKSVAEMRAAKRRALTADDALLVTGRGSLEELVAELMEARRCLKEQQARTTLLYEHHDVSERAIALLLEQLDDCDIDRVLARLDRSKITLGNDD